LNKGQLPGSNSCKHNIFGVYSKDKAMLVPAYYHICKDAKSKISNQFELSFKLFIPGKIEESSNIFELKGNLFTQIAVGIEKEKNFITISFRDKVCNK